MRFGRIAVVAAGFSLRPACERTRAEARGYRRMNNNDHTLYDKDRE
ncbi:MAG: hypothetical protein HYX75_19925 [Acidobacteria bacterium]|nr:hypothetical protein [Acidobacteriota bacterium]